jgi:pimeloyl-ACP methyl ester carboxylesterase
MPTLKIPPELELYYETDCFAEPWTKPENLMLLHGCAESGIVWYDWMPHLARRFNVVRPDMRGFGRSSPMRRDFPWSLDVIIDDYTKLMDALGIDRCHVVAAKIGGTIARARSPRAARTAS